jgi:hypothetical protein
MTAQPVIIEPIAKPLAFPRPRAFTVPKRPAEVNEDTWQCSGKGAGAVSDGASISFDSASWSRLLARRFARRPHFDRQWLAEAVAAYAGQHDRDGLPWMQQAAFDRGSFASLLGISDRGGGRIAVLAIGDSLAVLCDGDRVAASFPYDRPEQFDADPQLLSTDPAQNAFLAEPEGLARLTCEWDLASLDDPALLCVTDALGRWILSQQGCEPSPIARLRRLRKPRQFARLVEDERAAGRLRRDDTTLLGYWGWRPEPPPC